MFRQTDQLSPSAAAPAVVPRLEASGNTASTRAQLAYALLCDGQYDEALAELRIALDDNPELSEAHLVHGLTLTRKGRHQAAIGPFRRAIEFGEQPRLASFALAAVYLKLENFERALELADGLIAGDAADAHAHALRGEALSQLEQLEPAITSFRTAAQLDPASPAVRLRLGELLATTSQMAEAATELQAALDLMPTEVKAVVPLLKALRQLGQPRQAVELCRRAMPYLKPTGELYQALAECSLDAGMFFDAMIALRVAMALEPQSVACQQLMSRVMAQHGRHEEARQYEEAARRLSAQATSQEPTSGTAAATPITFQ